MMIAAFIHAPGFHEPRLKPARNTFVDESPSHSGLKRSRSFSGYIPYNLGEVTDEDACLEEAPPFQRQASEDKETSYRDLDLCSPNTSPRVWRSVCSAHEEVAYPACSLDRTPRTLPREGVTCSPDRTTFSFPTELIGGDDCWVKDSGNKDVLYHGPYGPVDLRSPGSTPRCHTTLQPCSPLHSSRQDSMHLCATPAESNNEDCTSDTLAFSPLQKHSPAHVLLTSCQIHKRSATLPEPGPEASPTSMHPSIGQEPDEEASPTYPPGVFSSPLVSSVAALLQRSAVSCDAPTAVSLDSCQPNGRRSLNLSSALASNALDCSFAASNDPVPSAFNLATHVTPSPERQASCRKDYLSCAPSEPNGDLMVEILAKSWASRQESKERSWASCEGSKEGPCPLPQPSHHGPTCRQIPEPTPSYDLQASMRPQFSGPASSYNLHQELEAPPRLPLPETRSRNFKLRDHKLELSSMPQAFEPASTQETTMLTRMSWCMPNTLAPFAPSPTIAATVIPGTMTAPSHGEDLALQRWPQILSKPTPQLVSEVQATVHDGTTSHLNPNMQQMQEACAQFIRSNSRKNVAPAELAWSFQQEVEAEAATCNLASAELFESIQQEVDPFPDHFQAVLGDDEPMTTLMIRNLPRNITPLCLIRELNQCGFEGTFNFAYLPQSFNTKENLGFAFLNFMDSSTAGVLVGKWNRQRPFQMTVSQAPLNISPAMLQGLAANLQKWATPRLRRVKNRDLRPFVLDARTKLLRSLTDEECMPTAKNPSSYSTSPEHL